MDVKMENDNLEAIAAAFYQLFETIEEQKKPQKKSRSPKTATATLPSTSTHITPQRVLWSLELLLSHFQAHHTTKDRNDNYLKRRNEQVHMTLLVVHKAMEAMERRFPTESLASLQALYEKMQSLYMERYSTIEEQEKIKQDLLAPHREIDLMAHEITCSQIELLNKDAKCRNLEVVKRDQDYELFFLSNSDGVPYFSQQLEKSIRLLCLFSEDFSTHTGHDPLLYIPAWKDEWIHRHVKEIYSAIRNQLKDFYSLTAPTKTDKGWSLLWAGMMALQLANNPLNMLKNAAIKGCYQYFLDLIDYVRMSVSSGFYTRIEDASEIHRDPRSVATLKLVHQLCFSLYFAPTTDRHLYHHLKRLSQTVPPEYLEDNGPYQGILKEIHLTYHSLHRLLQQHPNGPLFKTLDLVHFRHIDTFDPLVLGSLPGKLHSFKFKDGKTLPVLRIPSPTRQKNLNIVTVSEEFLLALSSMQAYREHHHLAILCGNRCDWRESQRMQTIEQLPLNGLYTNSLSVISLDCHSDFYNQIGAWARLNAADEFIASFLENLLAPSGGYFFQKELHKTASRDFLAILKKIHASFFQNQPTLQADQRRIFIDLAHHLISWYCTKKLEADSISFICKDAIDLSSTMAVGGGLLCSGTYDSSHNYANNAIAALLLPSLLLRDRLILAGPLYRMIQMLHHLKGKSIHHLIPEAPELIIN